MHVNLISDMHQSFYCSKQMQNALKNIRFQLSGIRPVFKFVSGLHSYKCACCLLRIY